MNRSFAYLTALILGVMSGVHLVLAHEHGHGKQGNIAVENPLARESPPTVTNGAVYMTLTNQGKEPDRLLEASTEVAEKAELHAHLMEKGVMKMRPLEAIEVSPGEPTVLKPGGMHIMLIDLKEPLKAGQRFPLILQFDRTGEVSVEVMVLKPGETPVSENGHKQHSEKKHHH